MSVSEFFDAILFHWIIDFWEIIYFIPLFGTSICAIVYVDGLALFGINGCYEKKLLF